jgi:hypothetical protein
MDFAAVPLPEENLGPVYDKALEGLGSWMPIELVKTCKKCGEVKELEEFHNCRINPDGKKETCKECRNEHNREYHQRPEIKDRDNKRVKEHSQIPEVKARTKARMKIHNQKPEVKARTNQRVKERRVTDPLFRFACNMRKSVRKGLKGHSKSKRTEAFLYCTFAEALGFLEKKFRPPMTRENMGKVWEVDHIRPICSFDLSDPEQVKACFHYTNLQPLFIEENRSKGGRY